MRLDDIYQRTARLLTDAKEQKQEQPLLVVFYMPDIDGEPIPDDAPPLEADGTRGYRVLHISQAEIDAELAAWREARGFRPKDYEPPEWGN